MNAVIRNNTRARVKVACPGCGMDLRKAPQGGFSEYGDTFCCRGCADGTGCTCNATAGLKKISNRVASTTGRKAENSAGARTGNQEIDESGREIGKRKHATAPEVKSRDQRQWDPRSKRLKSQNKQRVSTREQARGRSEQRGKLGRPAGAKNADRVARTGTKGK